jgi:hypothetical protein
MCLKRGPSTVDEWLPFLAIGKGFFFRTCALCSPISLVPGILRVLRAAELFKQNQVLRLKIILQRWCDFAYSDRSRKAFKRRWQSRTVAARERLEVQRAAFAKETGRPIRRVTPEDVKEEMRREAIQITRERIRYAACSSA